MELLEKIREALSRLAQLTAEELETLRADVITCADEFDALPTTAENVAVLNELADAGDAVMGQAQALADAAAQAEADKKAAGERIRKIKGEADPDDPEADEPETPEGEETPAEVPAEGEPVPAGVNASGTPKPGTTIRRIAAGTPRGAHGSPELDGANSERTQLIASGALRNKRAGDAISDRYDLARSMSATLDRMSKRDKAMGDVVLASAEWKYPEDRILTDDAERNAEIVDAITHPMALVATGGICSPVNVDWSLGTWAVADRPLRDGLPAFQASRGGLTYRTPPDIADLLSATGIWTEATDADPGDATKPVLAISCPSPETVYAAAVSTRLGFGNMQSRFDPETVAANTDLAIAAAAQVAELNLLDGIAASAVADITTGALLGASRGFLTTLDKARAAYKDIHRLSDQQVITVILPRWVRDLIRSDRVLELAHDGSSVDPLAIPDEYIDSLFAVRKIKPIWMLDGLPVNGSVYPAQHFAAFTPSAGLQAFPTKLVWHMFVEGTIQFLDGGRLDLGVVRDSTLDATNDYETFVETFEAIANRGFSAGCLQFVTTVCANGQSSATATVGSCL